MSLLSKLLPGKLTRQLVSRTVQQDLLNGRGNLHEDYPSDFSQEEKEDVSLVRPLSMTSPERLVSLSRAIDHLAAQGIGGDIVECGVWRGGSMLLVARKLVRLKDTNRKLYLFDTFEGMSEPGGEDVSATDQRTAQELLASADKSAGTNVWCYSSLDEVKSNMARSAYPADRIRFVQGKVEDTLPEPSIDRIALLRLDTDWYESTRHELETLYDKLVPGGILIIDDYGHWSGARKAVDEFIARRNLSLFLQRIDYTGRLAIKP
jgi:O-methyltransferase